MKKWKGIIVHHSAGFWGNAAFIDQLHKRKRGWLGIGYHFVILNGYTNYNDYKNKRTFDSLVGSIETGRPLDGDEWVQGDEVGAHALGLNSDTIGICMIHRAGFYPLPMITSLLQLSKELIGDFRINVEGVRGHYEVDPKKPSCPGIDMRAIRNMLITTGGEVCNG